jgi:hypothetical protein
LETPWNSVSGAGVAANVRYSDSASSFRRALRLGCASSALISEPNRKCPVGAA